MDTREYIVDKIIKKLEKLEGMLSDEAYAFLESYEDIEDAIVYQQALIEYQQILKDRFWLDEEDDKDEITISEMISLIATLSSAMAEDMYDDLEEE